MLCVTRYIPTVGLRGTVAVVSANRPVLSIDHVGHGPGARFTKDLKIFLKII